MENFIKMLENQKQDYIKEGKNAKTSEQKAVFYGKTLAYIEIINAIKNN